MKTRITRKNTNLPVIIEKDKYGFFAYCPALAGCYTQGDSYDDVIKNIKDAVKLCLLDEQEKDKKFRNFFTPSNISLTSIEVAI